MIQKKSATHTDNKWQFWVDRGGTFTDIVGWHPDKGIKMHKQLSENPEQYKDAALQGIRHILGVQAGDMIPPHTIQAVKMGTTVATNALLERKGDRTLYVTTQGLGDVLRIGYQNRPKLFDLHIKLAEMLYEQVAEVPERMTVDGHIHIALNEEYTHTVLQQAYDTGIRSVAIAFIHGYKYPKHEQRVAELARQIGFEHISTSHGTAPLIKLVSRGATTVVDAYLSPILRRYVEQIKHALQNSCDTLMFMQSHGGLTDAHMFQGKDAILSGPAGGVVGMVQTAQQAGFDKLIGFDMGGTSTDVCHFDGTYERSFETEVAGVNMRVPMLDIHTVAAGGGSILSFQDGTFRVGPESAGANPGPASYRRGGPLTVTDCNVLLGKIQADYFPHVFGENADLPLDVHIVRQKFYEMADTIYAHTGNHMTPEKIAEGFLRIAVENMANAIKKISVQRGYDVTQYALNCFGGAGGQHACLVADVLGMKKVLIHPCAGVLSALGMGLADIRALREHQYDSVLDNVEQAYAIFKDLDKQVTDEVVNQGINVSQIKVVRTAHVKYKGAHQSLVIPFGSAESMQQAFVDKHQSMYGFVPDYGTLMIESLSSEAIGKTETTETIGDLFSSPICDEVVSISTIQMYTQKQMQDVPLYHRQNIPCGQVVYGPAIILEPTGTNILEQGWCAKCDTFGNLILSRFKALPKTEAVGTTVDPIMLEVFNNLFMSIAEQMGETLANTAYSVNIKERLDFSCAIFDPTGNLVANAPHVPVHLGSMSDSVRSILQDNAGNINAGDVFVMNNPFKGGTHLPDITVISPVFNDTKTDIIFVVASRAHHADVGGKTPGSCPPDSKTVHEEGVLIDTFKLIKQGVFCEHEMRHVLASAQYPCRNIDQNMADLQAQVAANTTGIAEIHKMINQFGLSVVHAYMYHMQANAEEIVRNCIASLQDSHFTYPMDSGAEIKVAIRVDKDARSVEVDFTGTSPQDTGNYNAPRAICTAAVLYVFRTLVGKDIPMNEGVLKPIKLIIPDNSMINPSYPAGVIAGNTEVSQSIVDTLYGALGGIAGSQGTMNNYIYGNDTYQNYETICGGSGAGRNFDGTDAVHTHMTNTRMSDPEVIEENFPVRIEHFSIRKNSGGMGKYTGGNGVVRKMRFLESMTVTTLTSHRITKPFGVHGGDDGKTGHNSIIWADGTVEHLQGNDSCEVNNGDVFVMKTPGGGGYGKA